jgi:RNA polymerase sigma factor (sigma-70 family)
LPSAVRPFPMKASAAPEDQRRDEFATIFLSGYGDCVRFAVGMLGDRAIAEEAVQNAFVRLWVRPPRLDDAGAAKAYVLRTIANMGHDVRRRDQRRRVLEPLSWQETQETKVRDDAVAVDVRRAIDALPTRRRACVLLRYVLQFTEQETAEALEISIGTVKSQTSKALRQLREQLLDTSPGRV